ncbi:MAG: glycosyltransferase family 9 protein [Verrucomicrobiota bacterium]
MKRILVIRGGAIGDFILTLPALKALRNTFPDASLEILGYKHIAAIAENRFYAQAVRSIEYGPLSTFFAKNSELPPDLATYFASFDLIVSYLYDPDGIFETNLRRCGIKKLISGPGKIDERSHASQQLLSPITELGISSGETPPKIYPSAEDRQFAQSFLRELPHPVVTIHPGSGSKKKNWPIEKWIALPSESGISVVVSGEADDPERARIVSGWKDRNVRFARNLSLPHLAAVLENTVFIGHDSGISHLAAAAGAECILLFGPTDPAVWAPKGRNVNLLRSPNGDLRQLDVDLVRDALDQALMRIGINT